MKEMQKEDWCIDWMDNDKARKTDWIWMKWMNEGRLKLKWMMAGQPVINLIDFSSISAFRLFLIQFNSLIEDIQSWNKFNSNGNCWNDWNH